MPGFEALAPDQKAVLQLLLKQGKTYDDIAGLLRLDRENVRERALDALDALGADHEPESGHLAPERQDELADHLLLQQTASERAATRAFLETSAPGRAWARSVAAELAPIAGEALPDIPAEPAAPVRPIPVAGAPAVTEPVADEERASGSRRAATDEPRQGDASRLGGVLVLGALAAIVALAAVLLLHKGKDDPKPVTQAGSTSTATAGTTSKGTGRCEIPAVPTGATGTTDQNPIAAAISAQGTAKLQQQQINLKAPAGGGSRALGFAIITQNGLAFQAEGLKENQYGYKVWLWNSPTEAFPLGFAVYDRTSKRYAGTIQALPASAQSCGRLVLTRETTRGATRPGPIALSGTIKQG